MGEIFQRSALNYLSLSPFLMCFFLVLRRMPLIPGTGFMSLLLMGGGCRMGFGARVRQTGRPAAHIRIPVIPDACVQHRDAQTDTKEWTKHQQWVFLNWSIGFWIDHQRLCFVIMFSLVGFDLTCQRWVQRSGSGQVLYGEGRNPARRRGRLIDDLMFFLYYESDTVI